MTAAQPIAASIFKAYDIRGIVDTTLTEDAVRHIGRALGLEARVRGVPAVVVGRDGRLSGPRLLGALAEGLRDAGIDAIDVGLAATPLVYFAGFQLQTLSGVAVTGSHNPPEYNGLKMVLAGETLHGAAIQALRARIEAGATTDDAMAAARRAAGAERGALRQASVADAYVARVVDAGPVNTVRLARPMKVAIDAGNGVAGAIAPRLFRALGCEVVELFTEVDGNFPNHHPDPAHPENLQDLMQALRDTDAEIGLAFDGDGDRLGVVTKQGNIIWPDRQLMLFARDVLSRLPGAEIIFDVKCSRHVAREIAAAGGVPTMARTGHSLIKAKMKETGAPLAGEMSGHVFFKERWFGFDDGLYAGARLLEILSRHADPSAVLDALPQDVSTPEIQVPIAEGRNHAFVEQLVQAPPFEGERERITIDGLRVEFADGFGLVRASNTTPVLVCRFEAESAEGLARIRAAFAAALRRIDPSVVLPG